MGILLRPYIQINENILIILGIIRLTNIHDPDIYHWPIIFLFSSILLLQYLLLSHYITICKPFMMKKSKNIITFYVIFCILIYIILYFAIRYQKRRNTSLNSVVMDDSVFLFYEMENNIYYHKLPIYLIIMILVYIFEAVMLFYVNKINRKIKSSKLSLSTTAFEAYFGISRVIIYSTSAICFIYSYIFFLALASVTLELKYHPFVIILSLPGYFYSFIVSTIFICIVMSQKNFRRRFCSRNEEAAPDKNQVLPVR